MSEVKTIKLWDGIRVTTQESSEVCSDFPSLWECLNMTGDEYDELKTEITRQLFCFGKVDLTPQYHGYMVMLTIVRNKDGEDDE